MVGDHIRALKGGRWNHAIDCGDETVIHLAEDDAAPARVRRSYRPGFIAGADAVEVVRHRERTFPANEVVARAYSRISEPGLAAVFRDSESFAEWCVTGRIPTALANRAVALSGAAPAPAAPSAPSAPSLEPRPRSGRAMQSHAKGRASSRAAPLARKTGAKAKAPRATDAKTRRPAAKGKPKRGSAKPARKSARRGRAARRL